MVNVFRLLGRLFAKIGRKMAIILHFIGEVFSDEQVAVAMSYVQDAMSRMADNTERREWVARQLRDRFRLSESLANLLVELALQAVKKQIAKGVGKLEDILQDDDEPQPSGYPPGA